MSSRTGPGDRNLPMGAGEEGGHVSMPAKYLGMGRRCITMMRTCLMVRRREPFS